MDPNSYNAVIPPLAYTARIVSSWCIDGDEDDDSGSLMTLIWFVEIGDEAPGDRVDQRGVDADQLEGMCDTELGAVTRLRRSGRRRTVNADIKPHRRRRLE